MLPLTAVGDSTGVREGSMCGGRSMYMCVYMCTYMYVGRGQIQDTEISLLTVEWEDG